MNWNIRGAVELNRVKDHLSGCLHCCRIEVMRTQKFRIEEFDQDRIDRLPFRIQYWQHF